jgi:hypothetical protein
LLMTLYPLPEHNIPDEYLREIGRVAVEWSRVEAAVETMIWAFLFVDQKLPSPWWREEDGRAITTHINFLLRLDMLLSLATQCPGPRNYFPEGSSWPSPLGSFDVKVFDDLVRTLRTMYTQRNRIVHGIWTMAGEKAIRQTFRARGDVTPFNEFVSAPDIAEIADKIAMVAINAQTILATLIKYLRAEERRFFAPIS